MSIHIATKGLCRSPPWAKKFSLLCFAVPTTSLGARVLPSSLSFLPSYSLSLPWLPSPLLRSPPSMCEQGCFQGISPSSHLVMSCSPLSPSCSLYLAMILCFGVPTTYFGARDLPSSLTLLPTCALLLPSLP